MTTSTHNLQGTEIRRIFMFHIEVFINGEYDHTIVGGKKRSLTDQKALHGRTWEPQPLTKAEIREAFRQTQ